MLLSLISEVIQMRKQSIFNALFVKRLRESYYDSGMIATEVCRKANISRTCFYSWFNGIHQPDIDSFADLCKALNVSADYLLGISDVKEVSK